MSSVATRLSKFSSGSPIPMKTTFIRSSGSKYICWIVKNCPTISDGVRLRPAPKKPVTQNVQPTAQPACEERQTLTRSPIGM